MQKQLYNVIHKKPGGEDELVFTNSGPRSMPREKISVLHYHNRCEIGICTSGNGIWVMGNKSYAVCEGDIIVNPPRVPHYSRSVTTAEASECFVRYYYFDEHRLLDEAGIKSDITLADGSVTSPVVITRNRHGELWLILDGMIRELKNDNAVNRFRLAAHWYSIFLLRLTQKPCETTQEFQSVNPLLLPALQKIIAEFSEQLTVKILADACSLTMSYFNAVFKKCFGLTPMRYLNRFRVGIAAELLCESSISVTDISSFVGFLTTSELYRNFTALYGMSPTQYRSYRNIEKPRS